jgi:hypothetical protein
VVTLEASVQLVQLLRLRACRFDPEVPDPPLARLEPNGAIVHIGMRWPTQNIGIPGPQAEIMVQRHGDVVGRFVITPTPGEPVSVERRRAASIVVDVASAALGR